MNRTINTLSDLLLEEMADLLSAEIQLVEALPRIAGVSQSSVLKITLESWLKLSQTHVGRLQEIFNNIGQNPSERVCKSLMSFITEIDNAIKENRRSVTLDTAIIEVMKRVQQHEIFTYKKARENAADLGHSKIVEIFTQTLNEERSINYQLNEMAQSMINIKAIDPRCDETS